MATLYELVECPDHAGPACGRCDGRGQIAHLPAGTRGQDDPPNRRCPRPHVSADFGGVARVLGWAPRPTPEHLPPRPALRPRPNLTNDGRGFR